MSNLFKYITVGIGCLLLFCFTEWRASLLATSQTTAAAIVVVRTDDAINGFSVGAFAFGESTSWTIEEAARMAEIKQATARAADPARKTRAFTEPVSLIAKAVANERLIARADGLGEGSPTSL